MEKIIKLTFPGIIEEPGSFSGNDNSPSPLLGPEPRNLISLAIYFLIFLILNNFYHNIFTFLRETAIVLRLP